MLVALFNMKILVLKGWQGFADRLSVVSMILEYGIAHKAEAVCIDWRDSIWSGGDPTLDFDTVFELRDVPFRLVTIEEVAHRIRTEGLTIAPAEISVEQILAPPTRETFEWPAVIDLDESLKPTDPPEGIDVIVQPSNHLRVWSSKVLRNHLRIRADFATEWIGSLLAGVVTPFTAVHLRGTDHTRDLGYAQEEFERLPSAARIRIRVFADDPELYKGWMDIYGRRCQPAIADSHTRTRLPTTKKGSHEFTDAELQALGTSKRRMTAELLADFLMLSEAKLAMTTALDSMFFRMARSIRNLTKDWFPEFVVEVRPYSHEEFAAATAAETAAAAAAAAASSSGASAAAAMEASLLVPPWRRQTMRERGTFTYTLEEREVMDFGGNF